MEQRALLTALGDIKCCHQSIGNIGARLRRTKTGSKRNKEYTDALTLLEQEAYIASNKIMTFICFGKGEVK